MGTERQVYDFGRGLQRLVQQEAAIDVLRNYISKNSDTWIALSAAVRVAVANGDFAAATKQITVPSAWHRAVRRSRSTISSVSFKPGWISTGDMPADVRLPA
jgi:hypothetical protein